MLLHFFKNNVFHHVVFQRIVFVSVLFNHFFPFVTVPWCLCK